MKQMLFSQNSQIVCRKNDIMRPTIPSFHNDVIIRLIFVAELELYAFEIY